MKQRIKILLCLAAVIGSGLACAQQAAGQTRGGSVSGRVMEIVGTGQSPMYAASVRVLSLPDSSYVNGASTDSTGRFSVRNLPFGKYAVEVGMIGYSNQYRDVQLSAEKSSVSLGTIGLSMEDVMLGGVTVTADSHGDVKGCVINPGVLLHANARGKLDVAGAVGRGTLTVIRDIGLKEPYSGQIDLVSGEIAEDLTYYYAVSEQIPSSVGLGVLMNRENTVRQAGGFIIQLMPEADDRLITALEKRLGEVKSVTELLDHGMGPKEILEQLLGGFGLEILDRLPVRFHCDCSREKVEKALISVGREELLDMIRSGEPADVCCHFCGEHYRFQTEELKELARRLEIDK